MTTQDTTLEHTITHIKAIHTLVRASLQTPDTVTRETCEAIHVVLTEIDNTQLSRLLNASPNPAEALQAD